MNAPQTTPRRRAYARCSLATLALSLSACGGGGGAAAPSPAAPPPPPASTPTPPVPATFAPIQQLLDSHLPSASGDNSMRSAPITSFDQLLWATDETKATPTDVVDYHAARMAKVAAELAQPVTTGLRVWAMYNHGFIVKTPTGTLAFDLVEGKGSWNSPAWTTQLPQRILDSIDVLLVTHEHGDHYDETERIPAAVKARGGSVVYPRAGATRANTTLTMVDKQTAQLGDFGVTAHAGQHNVPTLMYEVVTGGGYRILHTGDNDSTATMPALEGVDLLLLNGWVDGDSRQKHNIVGMKNALDKLRPAVMVPGHFEELSHPKAESAGRYPYTDALPLQDSPLARSKTVVLTWGERLDFTPAACASGQVRVYSECKAAGSVPSDVTPERINLQDGLATTGANATALGLALADQTVWVGVGSGNATGHLLRYQRSTGQLEATLPAPGPSPSDLAFDGTALWMIDYVQGSTKVLRLGANGEVVASFVAPKTSPAHVNAGLAADGNRLFYAETIGNNQLAGGRVVELDRNTGAVLRTVYTTTQHHITGLSLRTGGGFWLLSSLYVEGQGFTNRLIALSDQGVELGDETPLADHTMQPPAMPRGLTAGRDFLMFLDGGNTLVNRMTRF